MPSALEAILESVKRGDHFARVVALLALGLTWWCLRVHADISLGV